MAEERDFLRLDPEGEEEIPSSEGLGLDFEDNEEEGAEGLGFESEESEAEEPEEHREPEEEKAEAEGRPRKAEVPAEKSPPIRHRRRSGVRFADYSSEEPAGKEAMAYTHAQEERDEPPRRAPTVQSVGKSLSREDLSLHKEVRELQGSVNQLFLAVCALYDIVEKAIVREVEARERAEQASPEGAGAEEEERKEETEERTESEERGAREEEEAERGSAEATVSERPAERREGVSAKKFAALMDRFLSPKSLLLIGGVLFGLALLSLLVLARLS